MPSTTSWLPSNPNPNSPFCDDSMYSRTVCSTRGPTASIKTMSKYSSASGASTGRSDVGGSGSRVAGAATSVSPPVRNNTSAAIPATTTKVIAPTFHAAIPVDDDSRLRIFGSGTTPRLAASFAISAAMASGERPSVRICGNWP